MDRAQWLEKVRIALEEINLSSSESVFKLHPLYRAGISRNSRKGIEAIFGESYSGLKNLRKLDWLTAPSFRGKLPEDSVIFFRDDKEGLIAASYEKQFAFKIFFSEPYIGPLEAEIRTLKKIQETEFAQYAPKILNEGRTANGGRWLLTSFCPNRLNPQNKKLPEAYLLDELFPTILPALFKFYKGFNPEKIKLSDWLNEAEGRIKNHPEPDKLKILLNYIKTQIEHYGDFEVIRSNIHHDIHSGNILMSERNITIIDWESEVRGLILVDIFDFWRRYIQKKKLPVLNPPKIIQNSFDQYREWMKTNFDVAIPQEAFKLHAAIYALERALLLFEKRRVNRLKDLSGMEYKILKAIE